MRPVLRLHPADKPSELRRQRSCCNDESTRRIESQTSVRGAKEDRRVDCAAPLQSRLSSSSVHAVTEQGLQPSIIEQLFRRAKQ